MIANYFIVVKHFRVLLQMRFNQNPGVGGMTHRAWAGVHTYDGLESMNGWRLNLRVLMLARYEKSQRPGRSSLFRVTKINPSGEHP